MLSKVGANRLVRAGDLLCKSCVFKVSAVGEAEDRSRWMRKCISIFPPRVAVVTVGWRFRLVGRGLGSSPTYHLQATDPDFQCHRFRKLGEKEVLRIENFSARRQWLLSVGLVYFLPMEQ